MNARRARVPAEACGLRQMPADIAMCFRHFKPFAHMRALRNCRQDAVKVLRFCNASSHERAEEFPSMCGMIDNKDPHPPASPAAKLQSTAIARALAMPAKVMLFDEVTSALDPEMIGKVTNVSRKLVTAHNLTMLMVDQQMGPARDICDRACFFGGKVEHLAPPKKLLASRRASRSSRF